MFGRREKQVENLSLSDQRANVTAKPNVTTNSDYSHSIDAFLHDNPVEPIKAEYTKLKDNDQTKHVLKFEAAQARTKQNLRFNRYQNIYPYDYNRIVLQTPIAGSDYINGSYITGEKSVRRFATKNMTSSESSDLSLFSNINFLETQGPLAKTCEQHLQAIYENEVDIIIMLTKATEGTKEKCKEYWPSAGALPIRSGRFEISNNDEEKLRDGVVRRDLLVMDCDSMALNCEKEVIQFQYLDWPDLGVPQDIDFLIKVVNDVRDIISEDKQRKDKFTILVHCSAGVGRSGTFLALYKLMEEVDDILKSKGSSAANQKKVGSKSLELSPETINIFNTVLSLRSKRVEMVQTFGQYKYLYGSVVRYAREKSGLPNHDLYVNYNL
jgi:protein tyrosine phosphatase